jgi:uncharacterized delta-60 repeat protein
LLWEQNVNGSLNAQDSALAVAVDNQGNVIAAGRIVNAGTLSDFAVAKFRGSGAQLWQYDLNVTGGGSDAASSVVVDPAGNVVAAGQTSNTGTGSDFTVAKFDRDGTLLWRQDVTGTAGGVDAAWSVATDARGNVIAAGQTTNTGTGSDFTVVKFSKIGTPLWRQDLNGSGNGNDAAVSVAVDKKGNIAVAGAVFNSSTATDFAVVKMDPDGTLLWEQDLHGAPLAHDQAFSVAVDARGNVIAAGRIVNTLTGHDFTVVKFDSAGTLLWQQDLTGSDVGTDSAQSVGVDQRGNVVAAGYLLNALTREDFTVVKFDGNGTLLWQQALNGTAANSFDVANSIAVDHRGDVVAAGRTINTGTLSDFTVVKFGGSGTLLWRQDLNGTANGDDESFSISVDNQGNVVGAGHTINVGTGSDFTVAKLVR